MREKPIVMPVLLGDEQKSVARKIYTSAPSMPPGTNVWVEVEEHWTKARVIRTEFAVLHLAIAKNCNRYTGRALDLRGSD